MRLDRDLDPGRDCELLLELRMGLQDLDQRLLVGFAQHLEGELCEDILATLGPC